MGIKMDLVHSVGQSPLIRILLQMSSKAVAAASPPFVISSAGMLYIPADLIVLSIWDIVIYGAGEAAI